jgi:hypothetical protein
MYFSVRNNTSDNMAGTSLMYVVKFDALKIFRIITACASLPCLSDNLH